MQVGLPDDHSRMEVRLAGQTFKEHSKVLAVSAFRVERQTGMDFNERL